MPCSFEPLLALLARRRLAFRRLEPECCRQRTQPVRAAFAEIRVVAVKKMKIKKSPRKICEIMRLILYRMVGLDTESLIPGRYAFILN